MLTHTLANEFLRTFAFFTKKTCINPCNICNDVHAKLLCACFVIAKLSGPVYACLSAVYVHLWIATCRRSVYQIRFRRSSNLWIQTVRTTQLQQVYFYIWTFNCNFCRLPCLNIFSDTNILQTHNTK